MRAGLQITPKNGKKAKKKEGGASQPAGQCGLDEANEIEAHLCRESARAKRTGLARIPITNQCDVPKDSASDWCC